MKQSLVSYMQNKVKDVGYINRTTLPTYFHEDYEPLWFQFMGSRMANKLKSKALNSAHERYMLMAAFISYVEAYDQTGYAFAPDAAALIKPGFVNTVNTIDSVIRSLRLLSGLKVTKLMHDLEYTRNEMVNAAFTVHLEGFIWFQPKTKQQNMNDFLHSLKGSLYNKDFPEKLKYGKLTSDQLLSSNVNWHPVYNRKNLHMGLGRTRGSMLVLKYEYDFDDYPIFYGEQLKSVDSALTDLWSKLLRIG